MKAYKVFNPDWTCRGFKYEIGKTYVYNGDISMCQAGFHACKKLADCFSFYPFDPRNKVAEVELLGKIIEGVDKVVTDKIKIVKELSWYEVLDTINTGVGNTGIGNSGHENSGHENSGNWNSGNRNSGNWNSGNGNIGDWNTGNENIGDWNSGNGNSGNGNIGDWNTGNENSGDGNSGNRNTGDCNTGDLNSGDCNTGSWNTGNSNTGNRNSGDCNSGDWNSGSWNTGNHNSGNWNSGSWNSGFFNTITPEKILVFNKLCDRDVWEKAKKPDFIYNLSLTQWIDFDDMTNEEKLQHPAAAIQGGYLKTLSYKDAWREAYSKASKEDIELLKQLPNFDADVFEEITGIRIK